jgi:hypothetical protein
MIEIENLTKACGLSEFRYWTFPSPGFDNVPASQISGEPEAEPKPDPAPGPSAAQTAHVARASGPTRVEPSVEPARPVPLSVLGEVAAVINPAPASAKSTRPARAARSAWRAAASPPHPR